MKIVFKKIKFIFWLLLSRYAYISILIFLLFSSPKLFAAVKTVSIPSSAIEKSYRRHPQTGDIYIDLIEILRNLNLQLQGRELISVQFSAKSEEISASDIFLAFNGRIENSLLLARKDNDSLTSRILKPLDRSPTQQAAIVFRGQTSLTQMAITFDSETLP